MGLRRYGAALACLVLAGVGPGPSAGQDARPEPSRVVAKYDAGLAGINLGEFKMIASFAGTAYEVKAHGKFSLLGGLVFKASGETTSSGTLTDAKLQPARFGFVYEGGKKRERRRMSFARGAVSKVSIVPRKKRNPRAVPVTAEQLQGVLDPLTAAFLSVRSDTPLSSSAVCNRTIPVFDGKQRFDITLSPKRSETLRSGAPKGISRRAAVCRVRYRPIAGHRPDHRGVQFMKSTNEIEVWLVRVSGTELYLPYKILVPTAWGSGRITLTRLKVKRS